MSVTDRFYRNPVRLECEFCHNQAVFQLAAQWTLFDFDHLYACSDHLGAARRYLDHPIDGAAVAEWALTRLSE